MRKIFLSALCWFCVLPLQAQWQSVSYPTTQRLADICFTDNATGYIACSNGLILKSTDFGTTWTQSVNLNDTLTSICHLGSDTIIAAGTGIYFSTNAGTTWFLTKSLPYCLTDLMYYSGNNASLIAPFSWTCNWSGGSSLITDYVVHSSSDGGQNWQSQFSGLDGISRFDQVNDSTSYVSGVYHPTGMHCSGPPIIMAKRTGDMGNTWADPQGMFPSFYGFDMLNDSIGYTLGYGNYPYPRTLYKKSGNAATLLKRLMNGGNKILFINEIDGYLCDEHTIQCSSTGGFVWNNDTSSSATISKLYNNHDQYLFAIGDSGTILKKAIVQSLYPDTVYELNTDFNSLDFDTVLVGGYKQLPLELVNDGSMVLNLTITSAGMYEISEDGVNFSQSLTFQLDPGQFTSVNVRFLPSDTLTYSDSLLITAPNVPGHTIQLSGTGTDALIGNISGTLSLCTDTVNVIGNVIIDSTGTLNICPGTVVFIKGSYVFSIFGRLNAIGTPSDSITFIPEDTTIGWRGLNIRNYSGSDTAALQFCNISYVKSGFAINIEYTSNVLIDHSHIFRSKGGIDCWTSTGVTISNNHVHDNNSGFFNGGGISTTNSESLIINNKIFNNRGPQGGGIHSFNNYGPPFPDIIQNLVYNNTASFAAGIFVRAGSPDILNNTICNNLATSTGNPNAGLTLDWDTDTACTVANNIIYNNSITQLYIPSTCTAILRNNNIQGGYSGGTDNIDQPPEFIDPTDSVGNMLNIGLYDWSLNWNSGCINTGDITNYPVIPLQDLAGNPRIYNNVRIDIGAYEFQGNTGLTDPTSAEHLFVFPNPTSGIIEVRFNNTSFKLIKAVDLAGRVLLSDDINAQHAFRLDFSHFESGTYLLIFSNNRNNLVQKLVIQH